VNIYLYSLEELSSWMEKNGCKKFHAKQVFEWLYEKKASSFEQMSNLSKELRSRLSAFFTFPQLKLVKQDVSSDNQTEKYLFEMEDRSLIETVLIKSKDRRTVCVSTQVGCPMGCVFCASGMMQYKRNLIFYEIYQQIQKIDEKLSSSNEKVTHVVFMGMGEPLLNFENVVKSIHLLTEKMQISSRRITVSTVGLIPQIEKLAKENTKINLALSLHAPNQEIREKIIPSAKSQPFDKLIEALKNYFHLTKRDVTIEYTLISGINDSESDAYELARKIPRKHFSINLIPLNPTKNSEYQKPTYRSVQRFAKILMNLGHNVYQRYTKGDDIAAACGQLAGESN